MRFLDMKTDYAFCESIEDKWIYFIKNARALDVIPKNTNNTIEKAYKIANRANLSKEELELQEKREDFLFIQKSSIEKATPDFAPKSTTPPCLPSFPKKSRHYKSQFTQDIRG